MITTYSHSKLFWKRVKPFFSKKETIVQIYNLLKIMNYYEDDQKVPEELNTSFKNAISNLI